MQQPAGVRLPAAGSDREKQHEWKWIESLPSLSRPLITNAKHSMYHLFLES